MGEKLNSDTIMITGHGMIPRTGDSSTTNFAQNTNELNKNLRTLNQTLCCLAGNVAPADVEYVPVYEYIDVQAPNLSANSSDDLYYIVSGTSLVIAFKTPISLTNLCGDFGAIPDSIVSVKYEDTLGHSIESANAISTSFANLLNKDFMATVTIALNSGFIYSFRMNIITNGSGEPTVVESYPLYSNSNASSQNLWVNTLAFQKPVQDLLEVWRNGVFVEYIKVEDHSAATVRYCLSYDPVQPFRTFDDEPVLPVYNNARHVYLNNNQTITIPLGTVHEVSFHVLGGTASVSVGGTAVTLPLTAKDTITATKLINKDIVITAPAGVSNYCYVKIIEP